MMSYCPECGSEVANQDPFCAYCGIALEVVSEPPVEQEAVAVDVEPAAKSPIVGEPEPIKTSASISDEIIADKLESDTSAEGDIAVSTPPTPHILDDEADFDEVIDANPTFESESFPVLAEIPKLEETAEESSVELESIEEDFEFEAPGEEADLLENVEESAELEEIVMPSEANAGFANETVESIEVEAVEIVETPAELEFDATIIDSNQSFANALPIAAPELEKAEEVAEAEPAIMALPEEKVESQSPLEDVTLINSGMFPNKVGAAKSRKSAAKIVVPEEVLPPVLEEKVAVPEAVVEKSEANAVPVVSQNIESAEKDGRSYTNPNFGVGDTGGKGRKKLKPLDEGTVLNNRYEIVRKIGGGGMGAVYLASDRNLGGVLRAVKEMVQSYIADEQQDKAINDFKRESMLLTSLEHPSIPTIYDYFYDEKEGRFYLVMKYISGGDLAARLKAAPEGRIDEVSITDWAIQIADVLDYLHNRQPPIVYRDLKPSNIMIDGNTGKVMIIDFGIARWVNKEEKGVTAVGTMGYAPPELFSGNVEPRSDIYSLGSTMFHLLTGADPQSNPLLIFDFNKHPRPRQINSQLTDQMEQIIMRAVEYNSAQRFGSAKEMRDELVLHLDNLKRGSVTFGVSSSSVQASGSIPVFCGFCGQKIVASDMFCPFCGAQQPLPAQSQVQQAPVYAAPVITARLLVIGTSDLDRMEYSLEKESNLLGRRDPMSNIFPEVDVSKFDPQTKISRRHARIWRDGDVFMLEDLGSSNGTVLIQSNNEQIRLLPRQPQILTHGDKVKLGDTTLQFSLR